MDKLSRSKSSREGGVHPAPTNMNNLRSYSTSSYKAPPNLDYRNSNFKDMKAKKGNKSGRADDGFSSKNWGFNLDPELQRKKRVAAYKAYGMEGKMKGSLKKSFRWIKSTCNQVVQGFW